MKKNIIVLVIISLISIVMISVTYMMKDRQHPTLTVPKDPINVACLTKASLLKGVSASDNRDGYITEKVFVENSREEFIKQSGVITYVVIDSSNNVTKVDRKAFFDASNDIVVEVLQPLDIEVNSVHNIECGKFFKATDGCGNDITTDLIIDGVVDISVASDYTVNLALKSHPEFSKEVKFHVFSKEPVLLPLNIELKEKVVTVKMHEPFNPKNYLSKVMYDNQENKELLKKVVIDSTVNVDVVGEYKVTYSVSASEHDSAEAVLVVKVTE